MGTATTPTGLEYPLHHGETFHTPMGTATAVGETLRARHEKQFISLWGQQLVALCMSTNRSRNISYPYGDSNHREIVHVNVIPETFHTPMGTATQGTGWRIPQRHGTFHTPMGTKRKPICPIGHIGFYFIRSCYSHVTPPIPSAVLMPTPAYGAKCSSRFAIVR